jgi:threonine dehydrogenase-like Zn-dependent dehydrogenase
MVFLHKEPNYLGNPRHYSVSKVPYIYSSLCVEKWKSFCQTRQPFFILIAASKGSSKVEFLIKEAVRDPGPGEVLLKARKTLISTGTESICLSRLFEPGSHWDRWVIYPFYPGYLMVGEVVAVGPGVDQIHTGERFGVRRPHSEFVTVSTGDLYPVPDGIADEDAPWFGLATIVQNGVRRAEHKLGEAVVVIGLGLLGQLTIQYMRLLGARQIIAVDVSKPRLEMAQSHGATAILPMGAREAREFILDMTEGAGADVVYDITGSARVFESALALPRRFGRLVLLGDTGSPSAQHLTGDVVTKGLSILGAHDSNPPADSTDHAYWSHKRMADLFYTFLLRADMRVTDLITHRYSPVDAPEAYHMLREERDTAMGVLFDWTHL